MSAAATGPLLLTDAEPLSDMAWAQITDSGAAIQGMEITGRGILGKGSGKLSRQRSAWGLMQEAAWLEVGDTCALPVHRGVC